MAERKESLDTHSYSKCGGCGEDIRDKYLLKAMERLWHVYCLRCSDCRETLDEGKCFFRDGNILCEIDFFRRYGRPCSICNEGISPKQSVRKVLDKVYHISCFTCVTCKRQLSTGDLFYLLDNGRVICKEDLEENKFSGESNPSSPFESPKSPIDTKSKRVRTFITTQQLNLLKSVYHTSPRPDFAERHRISKITGLDMRVVQVWFQNHRAKERRQKNKGKNHWINMLAQADRRRSRSLDLTQTAAPSSPLQDGHVSDMMYTEDEGTSHLANSTINVAQGMDVFTQPSIPDHRPAPLILPTGVLPPLSPSVHDVPCRSRFVFPLQRSSSFPPVHELLNLCEEELRTIRNQDSICTQQQSPTQSYYADSESERSNVNTPAATDEQFFVFPDVPATPDQRMQLPQSGAFSFETEVISNSTHGVRFF